MQLWAYTLIDCQTLINPLGSFSLPEHFRRHICWQGTSMSELSTTSPGTAEPLVTRREHHGFDFGTRVITVPNNLTSGVVVKPSLGAAPALSGFCLVNSWIHCAHWYPMFDPTGYPDGQCPARCTSARWTLSRWPAVASTAHRARERRAATFGSPPEMGILWWFMGIYYGDMEKLESLCKILQGVTRDVGMCIYSIYVW